MEVEAAGSGRVGKQTYIKDYMGEISLMLNKKNAGLFSSMSFAKWEQAVVVK